MRRAAFSQLLQQSRTDEIPTSTTAVIGGHLVGLVVSAASPAAEADTGCINHIGQVGTTAVAAADTHLIFSYQHSTAQYTGISPSRLCMADADISPDCHYLSTNKLRSCW